MSTTKSKKTSTNEKIDRLMDEASESLAHARYFECDRLASEALELAHQGRDFDQMARILLPIQESRRQRRLAAADTGQLFVINDYARLEQLINGGSATAGCYLLEPPLVGADGRDLRDSLIRREIPAIVLVHEPLTQLGLWPIVMIGPITVRTRIQPPKKKPTIEWMLEACESLGDAAVASVDPGVEALSRVEQLYERLGTVLDHEKLIQALEQTCREGARAPKSDAA